MPRAYWSCQSRCSWSEVIDSKVKSDRAQTLLNTKNPILKMYGFSMRSFRAYSFLNLYRSDTSRIMLQILFWRRCMAKRTCLKSPKIICEGRHVCILSSNYIWILKGELTNYPKGSWTSQREELKYLAIFVKWRKKGIMWTVPFVAPILRSQAWSRRILMILNENWWTPPLRFKHS